MATDTSPAVLEQTEAESLTDFEDSATDEAKAALGMRGARVGGGVALAVPRDPTGFWSKVLGLGFTEPVTVPLLEQVFAFYRDAGMSTAALQIAPDALPADWDAICAQLNISPADELVKLAGDLSGISDTIAAHGGADSYLGDGLRLEPVRTETAREWAMIMWRGFGFPAEHQLEMAVGTIGRPGWQGFAVYDGDTMIASANLRTSPDGVGHLFGGATLPAARGRGGQSALIAARAEAAHAAGCHLLIGETAVEAPGEHNPSLHNMTRAGLSARYVKKNWVWRAAAD
jgi:GNAT superfamily N-acetyltransferase